MKVKLLILILFIVGINHTLAYNCDNYNDKMIKLKSQMSDISYKRNTIESDIRSELGGSVSKSYFNLLVINRDKKLVTEYNSKVIEYNRISKKYSSCTNEQYDNFNFNFKKGYSAYEYGNYKESIKYYEKALMIIPNDLSTKNNLNHAYYKLADGLYEKGNYNDAIKYYRKAEINGYRDKYLIYFNTGVAYYMLGDIKNALGYYNKALDETFDKERIKDTKERIELVNEITKEKKELEKAKKDSKSNDTYSYKQYYLNELNIPKAKRSFSKNKQVIIAIIDDGININHPDLTNNIWTNTKEKPGNGIDDDNNGYIDDYNGWNFIYNSNNLFPLGTHGTMIAGIIGASSDNKKGITGISRNIKLMPVGVCNYEGCKVDNISKGIKYAVDNGANIINLSLGGHQFNGYTIEYDNALKYAYNKGVIIVIAAGNGDVLSSGTQGVNTTNNKISPVCNEGNNTSNIIGVGAYDKEGYRAHWSNYGSCIDVYAFGENIFSTSVPLFAKDETYSGNYEEASGTSFSAPIVTGIIGLGYNKYGKVKNYLVWNALNKSVVKNSVGNNQIDANKYLTELGKYIKNEEIKENERQAKIKLKAKQAKIKQEIDSKVNNILRLFDKKLFRYTKTKKEKIFNQYIKLLTIHKEKLEEGIKKEIFIGLIDGMKFRIGKKKENNNEDALDEILNSLSAQ